MIHDFKDREDEVDIMIAAKHVSPRLVGLMRRDGGGLLCVALGRDIADQLGLPYLHDVLRTASERYSTLKILVEKQTPYGGTPAFSITIDHIRTYTGISDYERSLTIKELSEIAEEGAKGQLSDIRREFALGFRSPGHVHLLIEAEGSLAKRKGHTELSVYLCRVAGLPPVAAICEMLDTRTHRSMKFDGALRYAKKHSIPLIRGEDVVNHFLDATCALTEH